jgi:hypothetical protein
MRHRCDRGLPRGVLAWCSNIIPDGPLRRLLGILALSCHGSNLTSRSLQGSGAVQCLGALQQLADSQSQGTKPVRLRVRPATEGTQPYHRSENDHLSKR